MPQIFVQDASAGRLDYKANFATAMQDDEDLSAAPVWAVAPDGPTLEDQADTSKDSTVFLAPPLAHGTLYRLTCTGTTTYGRVIERTLQVRGWDR